MAAIQAAGERRVAAATRLRPRPAALLGFALILLTLVTGAVGLIVLGEAPWLVVFYMGIFAVVALAIAADAWRHGHASITDGALVIGRADGRQRIPLETVRDVDSAWGTGADGAGLLRSLHVDSDQGRIRISCLLGNTLRGHDFAEQLRALVEQAKQPRKSEDEAKPA